MTTQANEILNNISDSFYNKELKFKSLEEIVIFCKDQPELKEIDRTDSAEENEGTYIFYFIDESVLYISTDYHCYSDTDEETTYLPIGE